MNEARARLFEWSLNHWRRHNRIETDKVGTGYTNFFISTDRLPSQTGKYQHKQSQEAHLTEDINPYLFLAGKSTRNSEVNSSKSNR